LIIQIKALIAGLKHSSFGLSGYQLKTGQNSRESFSYRSHAERSSLYTHLKARHSGIDCRNLGYMDVYRLPSMALDTGFPAGMMVYLTFVYNDKRGA